MLQTGLMPAGLLEIYKDYGALKTQPDLHARYLFSLKVRVSADSNNIPIIKFLSPASKIKRLTSIPERTRQLHDRIESLENLMVELSEQQSKDMSKICKYVDKNHRDELELAIAEAGPDTDQVLINTWKEDVARISFYSDQDKNTCVALKAIAGAC
eukprot:scpid13619/ scgid30832/ 